MKRSVSSVSVIQKNSCDRVCAILMISMSLVSGTFSPAMASDGPLFAAPFLSFGSPEGSLCGYHIAEFISA